MILERRFSMLRNLIGRMSGYSCHQYCWMNMGLQKAQVEYQCAYHGAKVREGCRTYFEREGDDARDSNASSPGTITSSELVEKVDSVIDDEYVS
ncbi:hypothetical protein LINPERHAP2_LOCUS33495 [Linum perenne]